MPILVNSPARLHFGIIDLSGALGRKYGSIGLAIDGPRVEIHAKKSDDVAVICREGVEISPAEVRGYAKRVMNHYRIDGGVHIAVERDIPKHVGLGSTTQISLSTAAAITKLYGVGATVRELSALIGRGGVSGIGTAAFEAGGFIIDGGVGARGGPSPTTLRIPFPKDWPFVTVLPAHERGLSGVKEKRVFREISAPPTCARRISHILVMKMLPAVVEKDITEFGAALTAIQELVGKSFSCYQRGSYHSRKVEDLVKFLLENGAQGSGQSSWGPTVYGVVEGMKNCRKLKDETEKFMGEKGIKGRAHCATPNNRGASVKRMSD